VSPRAWHADMALQLAQLQQIQQQAMARQAREERYRALKIDTRKIG
jgi:hypothetical protein